MGLTKRLLYMDIRRGCWSKRSATPWKNKNIFFSLYGGPFCYYFSIGRALCYVFLLMRDFFHCMEAFLLLFLNVGVFLLRLPPGVGPFSQCGGLFANFFSMWGDFFVFIGDFMSLWFFYGLAPSPPMIFFEGACYYVTFIPCPPRSLTAAR